ncbi:MFS transporter [Aeromicrobium camelliae]|uniref:MFS transporter n=1 Tax=Aeromicrobium camelliae TaxID=1538144 RepID=A0A3N6WQK2_9ACTN|nr:MFS transporter [Aeromicrobium camelliae]RQN09729.1 MFS transporter [Aeromicrobium camelliae]
MSAVASYRALLRTVGPAYVLVAFLGRIPLAMSQLGTLVMVSEASGRYAWGGAAAGALAIANAVGAPIAGLLADRIGQRPVVLVQSILGAVGLVSLVVVTTPEASRSLIVAVAAVTGLMLPQVGPLARVRWRPITERSEADPVRRRRLVDAAFSYEGAADEASFVLGPALIGVLGVLVDPAGAVVTAGLVLAVFGTWFAVHPTARLVKRAAAHAAENHRFWSVAFVVLISAQFCVGTLFGSIQTGTTVLATAAGQAGLAGLIHACLGIGSVIAGLAITALPERILYSTRMLVAAAALFALALPLFWVDSLAALVAVIVVLGFAVAPYMISNFALAGILVPLSGVGTAMTFLAAATGLGYATGAAVAGRAADAGGHQPAFVVTMCAAGGAFLLALLANPILRRARVVNA